MTSMLKIYILFFLTSTMAFSQDYELIWSEEFDAPILNAAIWNIETGFGKNYEEQLYTSNPENIRLEDGKLVITALKGNEKNSYTSARINTLNKQHFKYGRIEVRAKLPNGSGTWPAIWMLGANHLSKGYPYCGEIDIMEHVGKSPNEIHGAVHFPLESEKLISSSDVLLVEDIKDTFHVYAIEWDRKEITYSIDETAYFRFDISQANQTFKKNVFRKPFYLIINLALGGNWAGEIEDSIFPAQLYIDYIKYYK